jgi:hypothetical protein
VALLMLQHQAVTFGVSDRLTSKPEVVNGVAAELPTVSSPLT